MYLRCPNCPALFWRDEDEIILCCPYCGEDFYEDTFVEISEEEAEVLMAEAHFLQMFEIEYRISRKCSDGQYFFIVRDNMANQVYDIQQTIIKIINKREE